MFDLVKHFLCFHYLVFILPYKTCESQKNLSRPASTFRFPLSYWFCSNTDFICSTLHFINLVCSNTFTNLGGNISFFDKNWYLSMFSEFDAYILRFYSRSNYYFSLLTSSIQPFCFVFIAIICFVGFCKSFSEPKSVFIWQSGAYSKKLICFVSNTLLDL